MKNREGDLQFVTLYVHLVTLPAQRKIMWYSQKYVGYTTFDRSMKLNKIVDIYV